MSTDINPNTPVTGGTNNESVEINNAEQGASFEELESMFLNPEHRNRTPKREKSDSGKSQESKKEVKVEEPKEADTSGKTKDLRPNAKSDEKKTETKKETSKDEKAGEKEESKLEKQIKKMLKARHGDKELEIDEDTEVFVKVNGQEIPVKASELAKNYSGKVAWEKKFTEVDLQNRRVKGDFQRLDGMKSQIREALTEQDPTIRLFRLAEISGADPMTFRKNFFEEMTKEVETWLSMSDEERKAKDLEFENRFLKFNHDRTQKQLAAQQTQRELETKVRTLLQKTGIEPKAFQDKYEELASYSDREKQILEQYGKFANGKPTPEYIVETIEKNALWDATVDALEGVKTDWTPELRNEKIFNLVESAHRDGMKPGEIAQIVHDVWGKGRAKKIVEEAERDREEHYTGKKEVPVHSNSPDVWNFDQL